MVTGREVERVFLLDRMPELPSGHTLWRIEQGYLLPPPESEPGQAPEGRIRRTTLPDGTTRMTHTIKRGMGLVREEQEGEITPETFASLWPLTEGRRIRKDRIRVREGSLVWEIDRFLDFELFLAEVELPNVETPVEPPAWLQPRILREVTEEPAFRNYELARATLPGDRQGEGL